MPKLALTQGAYQARSLAANAQRCVNLYPEVNVEGAPFPTTHYPTPGLSVFSDDSSGVWRGLYRATNGELFGVLGDTLYYIASDGTKTSVITIDAGTNPVSMADNGIILLLVDGTVNGYGVELSSHNAQQLATANFYGATRVDYVDTYFVLNRPGTNQWYISGSNIDYASLTGGGIDVGVINDGGTYPAAVAPPGFVYEGIPLTGGTGAGAIATLTPSYVTGGIIDVEITNPGAGYTIGDVLTATVGGGIDTMAITNPGSGYTDGVYLGNSIIGGTGVGARVNITISGGVVTGFSTSGVSGRVGGNYTLGDIITLQPGYGGSGFSATVTVLTTGGSGLAYEIQSITEIAFDPLDIASKTGYADPIQSLIVMHREIWLIGALTSEVWYNTGASDFTFGIMPGTFIEQGCVAPYSLAKQDLQVFWLSQDLQGHAIVIMGAGYLAQRISTHAIEYAFGQYATISDAIGYTYQEDGHTFYVLTFPSANATWAYDVATKLWHERASIDDDGNLNRHRSNCCAFAYGKVIVGDYENGKIYEMSLDVYEDDGVAIPRIRSFPHLQNEGDRVIYNSFTADMEVGNESLETPPQVVLKWSDTRGVSYGNGIQQSLGATGEYLTSPQWNRLGLGRDRVFEISWSSPVKTSLNGAYITVTPCGS